MRDPRLTPLVIAAHGSADPRFDEVVSSIAAQVRRLRPDLDVRVGYLEHGPTLLAEVVDAGCVVVPLLLTSGYHVRVDIPAQVSGVTIAIAVGPDAALAIALADRLFEAGYDGRGAVVLAAAGSSDPRANTEVNDAARHLAARLDVDVTCAFLSASSPRLDEVNPQVVSSYLLAPGAFHDAAIATNAPLVSAPLGAHPVLAELVLARYDAAAQVPGRTAPA